MKRLSRFIGLGCAALLLQACEGEFAGNREFNIQVLNEPYEMKEVFVGAANDRYVAIVNTNRRSRKRTGSLQFFSLDNPESPALIEDLSLELPSNVLDFYLEPFEDGEQRLFILDRNENRILVYRWTGERFAPQLDTSGLPLSIPVFLNPVSVVGFEAFGTKFLAVAVMENSTIQFVDRSDLRVLSENNLLEYFPDLQKADYRSDLDGRVGALLETRVRGDFSAPRFGGAELSGRGIGKLIYAGGDRQVVLGVSYFRTMFYGFHFSEFDNSSNVLWDLRNAQRGVRQGENFFPGTSESGFRGASLDGAGNLYLSSRSDNRIHRVAPSVWSAPREPIQGSEVRGRNSLVLGPNVVTGPGVSRVNVVFDEDPLEEMFPRLGDLVVDTEGVADTPATRAWVLGLESRNRGLDQSRVYMLDLEAPALLDTFEFEAGALPQRVLYLQGEQLLLASGVGSNKIYVFDVSGDEFNLLNP